MDFTFGYMCRDIVCRLYHRLMITHSQDTNKKWATKTNKQTVRFFPILFRSMWAMTRSIWIKLQRRLLWVIICLPSVCSLFVVYMCVFSALFLCDFYFLHFLWEILLSWITASFLLIQFWLLGHVMVVIILKCGHFFEYHPKTLRFAIDILPSKMNANAY